jgi:hypothetical protein
MASFSNADGDSAVSAHAPDAPVRDAVLIHSDDSSSPPSPPRSTALSLVGVTLPGGLSSGNAAAVAAQPGGVDWEKMLQKMPDLFNSESPSLVAQSGTGSMEL